MRYHTDEPRDPLQYNTDYKFVYRIDHPLYDLCTLYKIRDEKKGLAVIQQKFDPINKVTFWTSIDYWLAKDIYFNPRFYEYFQKMAEEPKNGLYPTVTVRQVMWAIRMKPLKKDYWETVFDRRIQCQ